MKDLDSGGPKWARGTRPPPPRLQILSISCNFSENMAKSYVGAPLPGELAPPPRGNHGSATVKVVIVLVDLILRQLKHKISRVYLLLWATFFHHGVLLSTYCNCFIVIARYLARKYSEVMETFPSITLFCQLSLISFMINSCQVNYQLVGSSRIQCQGNGQWSIPPRCDPIQTPNPSAGCTFCQFITCCRLSLTHTHTHTQTHTHCLAVQCTFLGG